jgi:hypothetical protein
MHKSLINLRKSYLTIFHHFLMKRPLNPYGLRAWLLVKDLNDTAYLFINQIFIEVIQRDGLKEIKEII